MGRIKILILSILSGLLLALSWPTIGFESLIFISFVPLFFIQILILKSFRWKKSSVFIFSFIAFLIFNGITTGWISNVRPSGFFAVTSALLVNSILMSLVMLLSFLCINRFGVKKGLRSFIALWLMFEFLHLDWDLSWPWLMLGNVFSEKIRWIQWYEYTGVLGGSLWILIANVLLFHLIQQYLHTKKIGLGKVSIVSLVLFLPITISYFIFYSSNEERGSSNEQKDVSIVILQPNAMPYGGKFSKTNQEHVLELISVADSLMTLDTEYILAPETALPKARWIKDFNNSTPILSIKNYLNSYPRTKFIGGSITLQEYSDTENIPHTARFSNSQNIWYDVFNSAIQIDTSSDIQVYHKSKLVAGGEMMPFVKYMGFMKNLFLDLGGTTGSLGKQEEREVLTSINGEVKIAPVICYESIYGEYVTDYVKKGANLIFILTNDGWWDDTQGYKQHASYASIRAIETRRSIARSANTGISCFINSKGEVLNQLDWDVRGAIKNSLSLNNELTFYVTFGDFIGRIATFLGVFYLLQLIVSIGMKNSRNNEL